MKTLIYCIGILLTGITLFTGSSCKSTRKIQTAIAKKDSTVLIVKNDTQRRDDSLRIISEIKTKFNAHHIDYSTFSAKLKVNYEDSKDNSFDFTAFLRMKKDSVVWIRIEALLGIEAFRVLITPDSVFIMDKLKKHSFARSIDYLQEVAQVPFDFSTVQDLLIGNPIYPGDSIALYTKNENNTSLLFLGDLFKHLVTLSNEDYILEHSKLDDVDDTRNRTCDLTYNDYETKGNIRFSTSRNIIFSEKTRVEIKLNFKQFNFNEMLKYPFSVPSNYKKQ
jgi:hypothetical protein